MSYLKVQEGCIGPYLELVPVCVAVTPPLQRLWEGSAQMGSAGASVWRYILTGSRARRHYNTAAPPPPSTLHPPPPRTGLSDSLYLAARMQYNNLNKIGKGLDGDGFSLYNGGWRWHFPLLVHSLWETWILLFKMFCTYTFIHFN